MHTLPIPAHDSLGNLQPGIHKASLDELLDRFSNPGLKRYRISENYRRFVEDVKDFALGMYINGSYITKKRAPEDIDIVLVVHDSFNPSSPDGRVIRKYQMNRGQFYLHIFVYRQTLESRNIQSMVDYWQRDRDGNRKGIIYMEFKND